MEKIRGLQSLVSSRTTAMVSSCMMGTWKWKVLKIQKIVCVQWMLDLTDEDFSNLSLFYTQKRSSCVYYSSELISDLHLLHCLLM
jgi:hypothetical protein